MSIKKIGIIICFLILLAFAVMIVIFSYKQSGSFYCNHVLNLKKYSDIDINNSVRLYSLTDYGDDNYNVLEYNYLSGKNIIEKTEIVKVESKYPYIKITKFNDDKIVIDFYSNKIFIIKSGIVETYSANIYKDKFNAIYVEAIDENKNILNTVFGNNSKSLNFANGYICDNYLQF